MIARLCLMALSLLMAFAAFCCCYLSLLQLKELHLELPAPILLSLGVSFAMLWCVNALADRIRILVARIRHTPHLFAYALLMGIVIRTGWWWFTLPEVQVSDGASYFQLASMLVTKGAYFLDGHAFWPPGAPFIYAAFMAILGQHDWIPLPVNLLSFVICAISIRTIVAEFRAPPSCATLCVFILALWPELFMAAGQVSKETLLLALLPGGFALMLRERSQMTAFGAGLLSGLAELTQPALLFLPVLFGLGLFSARRPAKKIALRLFMMLIGMAVVIGPWTYRNYGVFGEFVLTSTNSGLVLHAGNQRAMVRPLVDVGGFMTPPSPSRPFKDDLAASRWHTAEAIKFIEENPADFAVLVAHRLVITMGDDSDSAFRSLRMTFKTSAKTYAVFKAFCNAFWLLMILMLSVYCWHSRKWPIWQHAAALPILAASATCYLMGVHGMAEGGARHHMAWSWIYALLLAFVSLNENGATGRRSAADIGADVSN